MSDLLPCIVNGCNKAQKKNDYKYCSMHRARLSRTGRLDIKTTAERIEEKSIPVTESGCWLWVGHISKDGYGRLRVAGKKELAHRASYRAFIGEIPDTLLVCHKCDNPSCVNPNHLFIGTHQDNMNDKVAKGRQLSGQQHHFYGVTVFFGKDILLSVDYKWGTFCQIRLSKPCRYYGFWFSWPSYLFQRAFNGSYIC